VENNLVNTVVGTLEGTSFAILQMIGTCHFDLLHSMLEYTQDNKLENNLNYTHLAMKYVAKVVVHCDLLDSEEYNI